MKQIKGQAVLVSIAGEEKRELSSLVGTTSTLEIGNRSSRFLPNLVMAKKRVVAKDKLVKVYTFSGTTFVFRLL